MSGVGPAATTKHRLQWFISRHCQVATVFSKGFYKNIQCRCGTYIMLLEVYISEDQVDVKTVCENCVPISLSGTCKVLLLQNCFGVIG